MKRILSLILILVISLCFFSCGVSDEEAKEIVTDLIKRSEVLNEIYYGDGLSYDPELEVESSGYFTVTEDVPFGTKAELLSETRTVFSDDMATNIITVYFDGVESYGVTLFARYITGPDGKLTVKADYEGIVPDVLEYDYSTLKIKKTTRNKIVAEITALDGTTVTTVELIKERGSYKIDTPTY